MAKENVKRVKVTDIDLKDRLVAVNRVTKVTKCTPAAAAETDRKRKA